MKFSPYVSFIATCSFLLCSALVDGSVLSGTTIHETVTLADLLDSQGTGQTDIPSWGVLGDAQNVTITHDLVGGYTANLIFTTGSIRAEVAGGNWFSDTRVSITPSGGTPLFTGTFISGGGPVETTGDVDDFAGISSSVFSEPNPGGGTVFNPGPTVFEFHENATWDELPFAPDNTITDLTIEFAEVTADDQTFELGNLASGSTYDATHSHAPGGIDFLNFTLPSDGTVDILTFDAVVDDATGLTAGDWGFRMNDTEVALFDSNGIMIAQNEDIGFPNDDPELGPYNAYSEIPGIALEAGDYTLVTTTWNSSLNVEDDDTVCTGCRLGDNIADVTAGADFGDFGVSIAFTSDGVVTPPTLACDLDGDGDCDVTDIDSLYSNLGTADATYDLNEDGMVDSLDISAWLADASDPSNPFKADESDVYVIGDANLDGDVNSTDLGLLLNNFGSDAGDGWSGGDLNGSSTVDSTDLGLLLNNFGAASAASAVPEPECLGLFALFALAAAVRTRRKSG